MRLGILGGTFDPIHNGHLDVALAAANALHLDPVQLVPSLVPPHRRAPMASAAHRFAMVALAIQDQPCLRVSDLEMTGAGPSYTAALLDRLGGRGVNLRDCFFVTGADAFKDIATWKDYPALLDRCHFVAVSRPGCRASDLRAALPDLADRMRTMPAPVPAEPAILLVDAPTAPVSATAVRRHIGDGHSIQNLVPAAVADYIHRHALYRTPTTGTA
jgi:nicotinate-nucleotide adenylyltransferase